MENQFYDFTIFPIIEAQNVLKEAKGGNQKGLFIALQSEEEIDLDFLIKILGAIQFDLEKDTHYFQCNNKTQFKIVDLAKTAKIKHVISFGLPPKNMGLNIQFELYQSQKIGEQTYLFAHSIEKIAAQKELKSALWNELKNLFLEKV